MRLTTRGLESERSKARKPTAAIFNREVVCMWSLREAAAEAQSNLSILLFGHVSPLLVHGCQAKTGLLHKLLGPVLSNFWLFRSSV